MKEKCTKKSMVVYIVIAIVLVCGSYYVGYQSGKGSTSSQLAGGGFGGGQRNGGNRGGGMVNGEVTAKDDTSITVKSRDGSSKIVLYSVSSTQVMKSTSGVPADILVGSQIMVQGKANTDGSVTAQTIQIRPNMPKTDTTKTTN